MDPFRFTGRIRYWDPVKASGLAVIDIPAEHVPALGGLKQQHVQGSIGSVAFASSVMPAGGGRLALSVSKATLTSSGLSVGAVADVEIFAVGRD
jgi:hypothetical protein